MNKALIVTWWQTAWHFYNPDLWVWSPKVINCCTSKRTFLETNSSFLSGAVKSPYEWHMNEGFLIKTLAPFSAWKTSARKARYDELSEQISATWFGLLTSHLLWQPKNREEVAATADWSFLCPSPSILMQAIIYILAAWVEYCMWKITAPPWNHLCFSWVSSYEILISWKYHLPLENWSGLLQTVSAISGIMATHFLFFIFFCLVKQQTLSLVWQFVQERTRGSGELLDMFWLEMTLARDTKRLW